MASRGYKISHRSLSKNGWLSSKDLYALAQEILQPEYQSKSFYDKSILERPRRNIFESKNSQLSRILDDETLVHYEEKLGDRTKCIHDFVGEEFKISNKEAIAVLCGSTDSKIPLTPVSSIRSMENLKSIYLDSYKLRLMGQSVFQKTRDAMILFGDVQFLATPWDDIMGYLTQMNHPSIILTFMKNNSMYKSLIPVRGVFRVSKDNEQQQLAIKMREKTAIDSFHLLLGILVIKYGQENVVENFIVPKILDGRNGIIELIMNRINKRNVT
ncbi:hypothetical protein CLIB1444_05S06128 [[Candida] jaroonii]|uniref:Uncharacterized protein n=1 Tax=[Candida] jaroonii TaxID=467808 RepID=A0ACA9Y877_9ASCO|nr:hypothetical protein CLIB1444_05S06128 [[Candida] jaroonii]